MAKLDLGKDSLTKIILKYGIPSICTMWIYSLYTIVDGIFIGKYLGAKEIAAVNIVMPYVNISFALGIMIAVEVEELLLLYVLEKEIQKRQIEYTVFLHDYF